MEHCIVDKIIKSILLSRAPKVKKEVKSNSSSEESSEDDGATHRRQRQRKIAISEWKDVVTESVQQLPEGIDGLKKYMIQPFAAGDTTILRDGRKWKKTGPTNWKGHRRVRRLY